MDACRRCKQETFSLSIKIKTKNKSFLTTKEINQNQAIKLVKGREENDKGLYTIINKKEENDFSISYEQQHYLQIIIFIINFNLIFLAKETLVRILTGA